MEWYFIILIVVSIFLFILFFPLFLQIRFYVNVLKNFGAMSITLLWFIPVYTIQFEVRENAINIITQRNQVKAVPIFSPNALFFLLFLKNILQKITLLELSLFCLVGKKNNAMMTALINGSMINIVHILFAIIHTKKGDFISHFVCDVDYEESKLRFSGYNSTFIFPITILWCLIRARFMIANKEMQYAR